MKEILLTFLEQLLPILATTAAGLIAFFGNKIKNCYLEKTKNDTIDKIINSTVSYVEQIFIDIKGQEKLNKAKDIAFMRLKNKGINIDDEELTIIIESFVRGLQ